MTPTWGPNPDPGRVDLGAGSAGEWFYGDNARTKRSHSSQHPGVCRQQPEPRQCRRWGGVQVFIDLPQAEREAVACPRRCHGAERLRPPSARAVALTGSSPAQESTVRSTTTCAAFPAAPARAGPNPKKEKAGRGPLFYRPATPMELRHLPFRVTPPRPHLTPSASCTPPSPGRSGRGISAGGRSRSSVCAVPG